MTPNQTRRLAELDAHLSHLIGFQKRDDDPNALKKAALGTAAVAGGAGLAALYARGRLARNGGQWGTTAAIRDAGGGFGGMREVLRTVGNDIHQGASATGRDIVAAAKRAAAAVKPKPSMLPAVVR